jgi:hypothetical protein
LRDQFRVGPGRDAELSPVPRKGFLQITLVAAEQEPCGLSQQSRAILASRYEFPEPGYRRCRCRLVRRFPPGVVHDLTVEFGQEDPVSLRTHIDHVFQYDQRSAAR